MREILFRGKRIDNGEWVIGYFWRGADHVYITPYNLGVSYDNGRISAPVFEVDRSTICQCTGLYDKKDKYIWENDIVRASGGVLGTVKFGKYGDMGTDYGIYNEWDKTQPYWRKDIGYWQKDIEVIGNIFDNQELLEVEHEKL